jgi:hypothetical protein
MFASGSANWQKMPIYPGSSCDVAKKIVTFAYTLFR